MYVIILYLNDNFSNLHQIESVPAVYYEYISLLAFVNKSYFVFLTFCVSRKY